jgi:putative acetyltransferase
VSEPTDDTVLRLLRPEDQAAVRSLVLAGLREHWGSIDPSKNPDLGDIASAYADATFLTAWAGHELVGTGALVEESDGVARIVRMSVAAHVRRRGLGRLLLDELCKQARASGHRRVVLETTETWGDVMAFYESCGFHVVGRRDGDVHMALDLPLETDNDSKRHAVP